MTGPELPSPDIPQVTFAPSNPWTMNSYAAGFALTRSHTQGYRQINTQASRANEANREQN
jgi:hypothetical protein